MALRWTSKAHSGLARIHAFLEPVNPVAAARVVKGILAAVGKLARFPRLGVRLAELEPREVRRLIVGDYELRYEVQDPDLFVLRLWHVHEDR
jgi:plasmid stabilization system protein ParE